MLDWGDDGDDRVVVTVADLVIACVTHKCPSSHRTAAGVDLSGQVSALHQHPIAFQYHTGVRNRHGWSLTRQETCCRCPMAHENADGHIAGQPPIHKVSSRLRQRWGDSAQADTHLKITAPAPDLVGRLEVLDHLRPVRQHKRII